MYDKYEEMPSEIKKKKNQQKDVLQPKKILFDLQVKLEKSTLNINEF